MYEEKNSRHKKNMHEAFLYYIHIGLSLFFGFLLIHYVSASVASEDSSQMVSDLFEAIKKSGGKKKENENAIRTIIDSPELVGSINVVDDKGKTFLHYAAGLKKPLFVALLFDKGARVDIADNNGDTALHIAARNKNNEIVQLLLDFGADAGKHNKKGESSRDVAKNIGNKVGLLLMENVKNERMMFYDEKNAYYEVGNYRRLTEKPRHIPLIMIVDDSEGLDDSATRRILEDAIEARTFPILASNCILLNLINYKVRPLKRFDKQKWELYEIPNTQFVLLIPKIYSDIYSSSFNVKNFVNQNSLISDFDALGKFLKINYEKNVNKLVNVNKLIDEAQLTQIFAPVSEITNTIWDIQLLGHGNAIDLVAGIKRKFIPRFLSFFSAEQKTNMLFITTCRAGGTILNTVEVGGWVTKAEGEEKTVQFLSTGTINYTIIVNATTDDSVHLGQLMPTVFNHYFNGAALLKGKGSQLDKFIRSINLLSVRAKSIHGSTNIPQVWIAGTSEFKMYNVDERIELIGIAAERIAEFEKKSIEIKGKQIVFVYPDEIRSLIIYPFEETNEQTKIRGHDADKKRQAKLEGIFDVWEHMLSAHELLYQQKSSEAPQAPHYLYPQLVSMLRGNSIQHIEKIVVMNELKGNTLSLSGVLNFIRDSFLDSGNRVSKKAFLIDSLSGNNDISITLEAARNKEKIKNKGDFELALQDKKNENIELSNVIVADYSKKTPAGYVTWAIVGCIYKKRAWVFYGDSSIIPDVQWDFKEVSYDDYNKMYTNELGKLGALEDRDVKRVGIVEKSRSHTYDNLYSLYKKKFTPATTIKTVTPEDVLKAAGVDLADTQDMLKKLLLRD